MLCISSPSALNPFDVVMGVSKYFEVVSGLHGCIICLNGVTVLAMFYK